MVRLSISGLMGLVAVVALGLAAMRSGSVLVCSLIMGMVFIALAVGSLGAMVRPSPAAPWRGFALFAWIYIASTFLRPELGWGSEDPLPFGVPIARAADRLHPAPTRPPELDDARVRAIRFDRDGQMIVPPGPRSAVGPTTAELEDAKRYQDAKASYTDAVMDRGRRVERATRIGHASLAVAFGMLGAVVGRAMDPRPGPSDRPPIAPPVPESGGALRPFARSSPAP
ncbi:hypothetical protein [Tautonia plasticadhaerens]|uniref:Uncharacterized protein n=1 Tax=Tautonia plasticadhaerens TaxID=2527974 RepID=A0A518GZ13_9BACT|nr:hypothetical protein [Tautonia plasticadhaerens]QDV33856.1 hypothetical protein ElP_17360 [Tautonia plasticadhaerens]